MHPLAAATPLPPHWRPWQRRKNTVLFHLIHFATRLWQRLPPFLVSPLSVILGSAAWLIAKGERRRASRQLALAMPELSAADRRRTVHAMFVHLARSTLELGHMDLLLGDPQRIAFAPGAQERLHAALALDRGVIGVSGHIGNWELLAQAIAHAGFPLSTVAKPLYDPRLTHLCDQVRRRHGVDILWRGSKDNGRAVIRALRQKRMLALLIDQDTKVEGAFVPFFHRPAHTPTAATTLAVRFSAPMVFSYIQRHGRQHVINLDIVCWPGDVALPAHIKDDVLLTPLSAKLDQGENITLALNQRLEAAIRQAPAQWVWLHPRWRTAPHTAPATQTLTQRSVQGSRG